MTSARGSVAGHREPRRLLGGLLLVVTARSLLLPRMTQGGYWASGAAVGVGIAYVIATIVFTLPTSASVRRWHIGQLFLVWLILFVVEWVVWHLFVQIPIPPSESQRVLGDLALLVVIVAVPVTFFCATWVWFGERSAAGQSPPSTPR
jgi:hypothetical protein